MSLPILCIWGLETHVEQYDFYHGLCSAPPQLTLLIHWLIAIRCVLMLSVIGSALLVAHLVRDGKWLRTSILHAASCSAVIGAVLVDMALGLFVSTPFTPPSP